MHLGIEFCMRLLDFGCQVGRKNQSNIDQKSHRKNDAKNKASLGRVFGRLQAVKGSRRTPTQRDADATRTRRAENPLPAAAKAAALRAKIPVKHNKETIVRVLTRPGPEARRIFIQGHLFSLTFMTCHRF